MTDAHLVIDPPPDAVRATFTIDLIGWLHAELGTAPRLVPTDEVVDSGAAATTREDSVLSIVLAIPPALVAVADLAERARVAERLRRLAAWLRSRRARARLRTPIGELALAGDDDHKLDEVLAQLAQESPR